jgi:hypothetical protein
MKGTIYGTRLPRGRQVKKKKKFLGTTALKGKHSCEWQRAQAANERYVNGSYLIDVAIRKCNHFPVFSFNHFKVTTTSENFFK